MNHAEYNLQKQVCQYLEMQYPDVMFLSDTIASIKLSMPQAIRNKAIQKKGFKCPDLLILEPSRNFHGLFIELKKETPYTKKGVLKSSEHLKGQRKTLDKLFIKGYFTQFAWTFEQCKDLIDKYLKDK